MEERKVEYLCWNCKKVVTFDVSTIGLICPYCGSRIFYKTRPSMPRHVKAR
jgi:DNA-directed RNA polymerase subunit P